MQSSESVGQTFHWVRRVHQTEMFEVWDGQSSTGQPTIMVLVAPGAINNQAARASFVDAVRWAQRPDITDVTLLAEDAIGVKPWAALAADPHGQAFAERLLGLRPSGPPVAAPPAPLAIPVQPAAGPVSGAPAQHPFVPGAVQPAAGPVSGAPAQHPFVPGAVQPAAGPVSGAPAQHPFVPGAVQPAAGPVSGAPAQHPFVPGPIPPPTAAQQPAAHPPWGPPPPAPAFGSNGAPPVSPGPVHWPAQQPPAQQPPGQQPPEAWPPQQNPAPQQPWDWQPQQPARSPDVPPLPSPQELAERRRRRSRTRMRVALIAGVVLVLAASAATAAFVLPGRAKDPGPDPKPTASGSPSPSASPSPRPTYQASAAPVAVLGATWQAGEATKVQDFVGWPFAFRTPADANCEFFVGEPDYKAYNCKWGTEPNHTVMAFVVRRCANSCDANEQAQFETMTPWKPDGPLAVTDATTKFVAVDYGDGRELFTMVHYFGTTAGGPPQWVVIAQGNTAKATRDPVLKTINDVRTQTP